MRAARSHVSAFNGDAPYGAPLTATSTIEAPPAEAPLGKPLWRGVLHHWAAVFALGAGLVLVGMAPVARAAWAAAGYALSVVTLFTVSAVYHRPTWTPAKRAFMRRLDHGAIFVLIAGTYTPICLLGLPPRVGEPLLAQVWIGALLGVLKSVFWAGSPRWVTAALYLVVGWTVVPHARDVGAALSTTELGLLFGGGAVYSLGALAYALRRPNPLPGVFGYHEVFHALTLAACAMHFILVGGLVRAAH